MPDQLPPPLPSLPATLRIEGSPVAPSRQQQPAHQQDQPQDPVVTPPPPSPTQPASRSAERLRPTAIAMADDPDEPIGGSTSSPSSTLSSAPASPAPAATQANSTGQGPATTVAAAPKVSLMASAMHRIECHACTPHLFFRDTAALAEHDRKVHLDVCKVTIEGGTTYRVAREHGLFQCPACLKGTGNVTFLSEHCGNGGSSEPTGRASRRCARDHPWPAVLPSNWTALVAQSAPAQGQSRIRKSALAGLSGGTATDDASGGSASKRARTTSTASVLPTAGTSSDRQRSLVPAATLGRTQPSTVRSTNTASSSSHAATSQSVPLASNTSPSDALAPVPSRKAEVKRLEKEKASLERVLAEARASAVQQQRENAMLRDEVSRLKAGPAGDAGPSAEVAAALRHVAALDAHLGATRGDDCDVNEGSAVADRRRTQIVALDARDKVLAAREKDLARDAQALREAVESLTSSTARSLGDLQMRDRALVETRRTAVELETTVATLSATLATERAERERELAAKQAAAEEAQVGRAELQALLTASQAEVRSQHKLVRKAQKMAALWTAGDEEDGSAG